MRLGTFVAEAAEKEAPLCRSLGPRSAGETTRGLVHSPLAARTTCRPPSPRRSASWPGDVDGHRLARPSQPWQRQSLRLRPARQQHDGPTHTSIPEPCPHQRRLTRVRPSHPRRGRRDHGHPPASHSTTPRWIRIALPPTPRPRGPRTAWPGPEHSPRPAHAQQPDGRPRDGHGQHQGLPPALWPQGSCRARARHHCSIRAATEARVCPSLRPRQRRRRSPKISAGDLAPALGLRRNASRATNAEQSGNHPGHRQRCDHPANQHEHGATVARKQERASPRRTRLRWHTRPKPKEPPRCRKMVPVNGPLPLAAAPRNCSEQTMEVSSEFRAKRGTSLSNPPPLACSFE